MIPELIILYVNPLKIFKSMWPDNRPTTSSLDYIIYLKF
jgi:hypothetical protein